MRSAKQKKNIEVEKLELEIIANKTPSQKNAAAQASDDVQQEQMVKILKKSKECAQESQRATVWWRKM